METMISEGDLGCDIRWRAQAPFCSVSNSACRATNAALAFVQESFESVSRVTDEPCLSLWVIARRLQLLVGLQQIPQC